jgi:AraC family transcriptional regulator
VTDASYVARINRVIDYIDAHLGDRLDLATLAGVARISAWHFHRVFQAIAGETPGNWVRRRRLEVAAIRLGATPPAAVLQIALEVGFQSAEVFTRAFRAQFGVTPTAWRRGAAGDWAERRKLELSKIHQADRKDHQAARAAFRQTASVWPQAAAAGRAEGAMPIELKTLPSARVAYLRYVGAYGSSGITRTWQRFAAWCATRDMMPPRRRMFGICHDSPDLTAPERCRYDVCVEIDEGFVPDRPEIGVQHIQAGRYACTRFEGRATDIHAAWMQVFAAWLPQSHYEADDRPAFELYDEEFALDVESARFRCQLCLPVTAI